MATQRETGGIPAWIWWIVGGLVALALLWMLLANLFAGGQMTPAGSPPAVGQPGGATTNVPFGQPDRLQGMVGQTVQLNTVMVQEVAGDRAFWVGPSNTERIFVVLEETATPGQPTEGTIDVNQGDRLNMTGEIRRLPSEQEMRSQWMLDQKTVDALRNQGVYLHVTPQQISKAGGA